jgi:hypothetical protein
MCNEPFRLTDNEIRRRVLETLYNFAQKETKGSFPPLSRQDIQQILEIPNEKLNFNMVYLQQKGLIELHVGYDQYWYGARITAFGIDVVTNKEKYAQRFPFIQAIQEIHAPVYAPVIQAVESQVNFQQVTTAFQQARNMTEKKEDIPKALREEVKKQLNLLEEELNSKEPDVGKIQTSWKWLKRNANWVVPTLTQVVLKWF